MTNMSSLGEKIRQIREAEGVSRMELAEILAVPYGTINNYEMKGIQVTEKFLVSFVNHPRFQKYALWLMTSTTAPESGQIAPPLSPDGLESTARSRRYVRKTG